MIVHIQYENDYFRFRFPNNGRAYFLKNGRLQESAMSYRPFEDWINDTIPLTKITVPEDTTPEDMLRLFPEALL